MKRLMMFLSVIVLGAGTVLALQGTPPVGTGGIDVIPISNFPGGLPTGTMVPTVPPGQLLPVDPPGDPDGIPGQTSYIQPYRIRLPANTTCFNFHMLAMDNRDKVKCGTPLGPVGPGLDSGNWTQNNVGGRANWFTPTTGGSSDPMVTDDDPATSNDFYVAVPFTVKRNQRIRFMPLRWAATNDGDSDCEDGVMGEGPPTGGPTCPGPVTAVHLHKDKEVTVAVATGSTTTLTLNTGLPAVHYQVYLSVNGSAPNPVTPSLAALFSSVLGVGLTNPSGFTDKKGNASLELVIPSTPSYSGYTLVFQALLTVDEGNPPLLPSNELTVNIL